MTDVDAVKAVLDGFQPIGDEVPAGFADFVADAVTRPSPTPPVDTQREILDRLDEIIAILKGGQT